MGIRSGRILRHPDGRSAAGAGPQKPPSTSVACLWVLSDPYCDLPCFGSYTFVIFVQSVADGSSLQQANRKGAGVILIIHAQAPQAPLGVTTELLKLADFIVLAGPDDAFDDRLLPVPPGKVGSAFLRLTLLQPQLSAFEVLSNCSRLFQPILTENLVGMHYFQPGKDLLDGISPSSTEGPVTWTSDISGTVTRFYLAPAVIISSIFRPLIRDLCERHLSDDQRFAFLAGAFQDYK